MNNTEQISLLLDYLRALDVDRDYEAREKVKEELAKLLLIRG